MVKQQRQQPKRKTTKRPAKQGKPQQKATQKVVMNGMGPKCGAKYALALANPFLRGIGGVCVPTWPAPPSFKRMTLFRSTMFTGSNNVGYLWYRPRFYRIGTTVVPSSDNDALVAAWTNATNGITGSTTMLALNTADAAIDRMGVNGNDGPAAAFIVDDDASGTTSVRKRIVATGVRIRYIGSELNKGGVLHVLNRPTGFGNSAIITPDNVRGDACTKRYTVSREWKTLAYVPYEKDDLEYHPPGGSGGVPGVISEHQNSFPSMTGAGSGRGVGSFFIVADSAVANQPFEFEIIQHVEIQRRDLAQNYTPSETFSQTEKIIDAATESLDTGNTEPPASSDPAKDDANRWSQYVKRAAIEVKDSLFKAAIDAMFNSNPMYNVGIGGQSTLYADRIQY